MADRAKTLFDLTPLNPAYKDDPHALLAPLRNETPVLHDELSGSFIMTRYADVRGLLSDRTLWRDPIRAEAANAAAKRAREARRPDDSEAHSILTMDDPDHTRIRQPLAQALYARVAKSKPLVEEIVAQTIDCLAGAGEVDIMARFCVPIPIDVIGAILGVDRARLAEFREWSEGLIQGLNPFRTPEQTADLERASAALNDYFTREIAARRTAPRDDLISDMVTLQAAGAALSDQELRINLTALLVGGNLTTTDLMGAAIRQLLLHPGELAKLHADPKLIKDAVEEVLRYDPPVDNTGRVASRDLAVQGCPIHKTAGMTFSLRAANRDPETFADPDKFDITREHKPHMAFGGGAHICIGAPLARLEAQVALARLFERFPNLRLARPEAPPQWRTLPFFRGLERLDVILD